MSKTEIMVYQGRVYRLKEEDPIPDGALIVRKLSHWPDSKEFKPQDDKGEILPPFQLLPRYGVREQLVSKKAGKE